MNFIHLISGPRNISTALMYSFAQRENTIVVDEPFYAYYLDKTKIQHPGTDEVLASQSHNKKEVCEMLFSTSAAQTVFIKNMAQHLEVVGDFPFERCLSVFLIRDPKQIIASYAQVIETPVMRDIGIAYQFDLYQSLNKNQQPVIIDSGLLLQNPESVLQKVCNQLNIPFEEAMLQWPAGPKPFDGVWALYWYANVHRSTGFEKQPTSQRPLPDHLLSLAEEADKFYQKLLPFAVKP